MSQRVGQWLSHDLTGVHLPWEGRIQVAPPTWTDRDTFLWILILGEDNAMVSLWIQHAALIKLLPKIMPQHGVPFTIKNSLNLSYVPGSLFYGVALTATAFDTSFWVHYVLCILLIKIKCKRKKDGSWQVKKITPNICQFELGSPLRIHHCESAVTQTSCLWRAVGKHTWLCGNTNICTFRSPQVSNFYTAEHGVISMFNDLMLHSRSTSGKKNTSQQENKMLACGCLFLEYLQITEGCASMWSRTVLLVTKMWLRQLMLRCACVPVTGWCTGQVDVSTAVP